MKFGILEDETTGDRTRRELQRFLEPPSPEINPVQSAQLSPDTQIIVDSDSDGDAPAPDFTLQELQEQDVPLSLRSETVFVNIEESPPMHDADDGFLDIGAMDQAKITLLPLGGASCTLEGSALAVVIPYVQDTLLDSESDSDSDIDGEQISGEEIARYLRKRSYEQHLDCP
jgi:hypothetical protein